MKHTSDTPYIVSVNLFVFRITKASKKLCMIECTMFMLLNF
jgi:hypothetical protein